MLANERPITNFTGLMLEAANMDAQGAAITGGDPLAVIDTTVEYIRQMKQEYGKEFHIHLYTSGRFATKENLERLAEAGLDEIRFHPQNKKQEETMKLALDYSWDVGAEIPVIPDKKRKILSFLDYLESLEQVKFCNLNEFEATESNLTELRKKGYKLKSETAAGIKGSEKLAKKILKDTAYNFTLHYCSSKAKDTVQFRNRLKRTAKIVRKPYEEIQDGMLVKAVLTIPKYLLAEEVIESLIDEYEVDQEMIALITENKIETSWYIADVLKEVLVDRFEIEDIDLVVEYPTFGRITIAKSPLQEVSAKEGEENPFAYHIGDEEF
jgi:hypothetical protein